MTGADDAEPDSLRALFDRASELPPPARAAWLDAHVPDAELHATLRRLLDADASTGYLDTPADDHATRLSGDAQTATPESLVGQTIGAFRLLRLLGQGGMASVFLGEREGADFVQRCAVKLLRRGLYSDVEQRLFQRERRVLATLQHPNIAQLIDGGVTAAGIPYLAMEYVDGTPINVYAEAHRLDLRARVRLVLTACEAVDAAHRMLVVHRDIKPSNLLVTADGTLKLLDFGIAKLLDDEVEDGTRSYGMFTPGYAAPEQRAGGAVTTATDVYALGVLLHELLLGERPDADAPRRPSSLVARGTSLPDGLSHAAMTRQLRGDLDTILLKALEADPTRRYRSAGALAADLDRYLRGRAVLAHPPSRGYLVAKFVQRHRIAVLAGTAFTLALVASLGLALWQAQAAREQARIARLEAQRANEVRDFVVDIFDAAGSTRPLDVKPSVDELVTAAVARVRARPMPLATRAELQVMLARVANSTSDMALAERLANAALADYAQLASADPHAVLEAKLVRIEAMRTDNRLDAAMHALQPLLPTLRKVDDPVTARGAKAAANVLYLNGRHDEAIAMARIAAARTVRVFGADSLEAREAAFMPGLALSSVKRYDEARAALEPAIAQWTAAGLPPQIDVVNALEALANADSARGDYRGAEARLRESLRMVRAISPAAGTTEAVTLTKLGIALVRQERFDEAEPTLDRALAINQGTSGAQSTVTGRSLMQRAELDIRRRRFDAAEQRLRRVIATFERTGFIRVEQYPRAWSQLAIALLGRDRLVDAEQASARSLALREELFGRDNGEVAASLTVQAMLLARQQPTQALEAVDAALAMFARQGQPIETEVLRAQEQRARILRALDRDAEALAAVDALLVARSRQPQATVALTTALALRAELLLRLDRAPEAQRAAREALALRADTALLPPEVVSQLQRMAALSTSE